jgi:hypothetical protein
MIEPSKLFGRLGNQMFQGAYLIAQAQKGEIPDIYVQGEEHFKESSEAVKTLYSQGIGQPIDMVAIHVRRGDYVNNPFYVDLMETDYYDRAMAEFPDEKFLVFSDDINWCRQQDIFKDCEFSEGNEIDDMNTMASCKGIIMANSSFSWWAAFLSYAKVIAPRDWYSDGIERTSCLDSWKRI